ncbi:MAG: glycosyltransferase family 39 protein [Thermoguttaceae bacterium]
MSFPVLFQQAPASDFPNGLRDTEAKAVMPRWGLVAVLLLVCFIPRAWIACHWDLVWTDSVTFLHAAEAIERGDLRAAFEETGLNVYPVILYGLRRLGLDWTVAGTWWSVLMATLAVLPLFGWVRRQFDDQVAVAACLAYAFHGKLMAVSVLMIRDPTFWLLFNLTLYLLWRAVTEVRWRLFFAAGLSLAIAVHTRSEGWLLAIPLVLWPAFRLPAIRGRRWKLTGGATLCLMMIPLCMAAVNCTWLAHAQRWSLVRPAHVEILRGWLGIDAAKTDPTGGGSAGRKAVESGDDDLAAMAIETDPMGYSPGSLSKTAALRKFGETFVKAYTYLLGLLALIGVCRWWRVYFRRDHQTLLLMSLILLGMIWVRNTQVRSDIRYYFPMVLVSFPWIGLGFLDVADWAAWLVSLGRGPMNVLRPVMAGLLACAVIIFGMCDTNLASTHFMREHVALGDWIEEHYGPQRTIVANILETRLVQYHSHGCIVGYLEPRACERTGLPPSVRAMRPDILLVWTDPDSRDRWMRFARSVAAERDLGYEIIHDRRLPTEPDQIVVLARIRQRAR